MVIPSRFEELEEIVEVAETFYKACFEDDEKVFSGVLLASEAVTNAIEHGNGNDESKQVTVEFRATDEAAELWVEDEGEGFDRDSVSDPLSNEHLLDDGGRGIFLIERLADRVVYENEGRRIGIVFNRA